MSKQLKEDQETIKSLLEKYGKDDVVNFIDLINEEDTNGTNSAYRQHRRTWQEIQRESNMSRLERDNDQLMQNSGKMIEGIKHSIVDLWSRVESSLTYAIFGKSFAGWPDMDQNSTPAHLYISFNPAPEESVVLYDHGKKCFLRIDGITFDTKEAAGGKLPHMLFISGKGFRKIPLRMFSMDMSEEPNSLQAAEHIIAILANKHYTVEELSERDVRLFEL